MVTAYDYPTARVLEACGVDLVLVGDSLAMAVLGLPDTRSVGMDEMLHHTRAVARACKETPVVADMPIHSYPDPSTARANAERFLEAGADAVKIEGCLPRVIQALTRAGVPVMAHLGLLPQTAAAYRVQGRDPSSAKRMVEEARRVEKAGAFSLVLECVPSSLGARITRAVSIPTIGIGAGPHTRGQVLVFHDLVGANPDFKPRFVKRYANLHAYLKRAVQAFCREVRSGAFPDPAHSYR